MPSLLDVLLRESGPLVSSQVVRIWHQPSTEFLTNICVAILIVANTVPMAKRPIYTGLIGGMYGIASVVGPLLGGGTHTPSALSL